MILNNISVFSAMARNYHTAAMNRSMIGYTIKKEFGPFTQREFDQYAAATGDDPAKYFTTDSPAPPFFFFKELFPIYKKIITHSDLKLDIMRMVHGFQGLNCFGHIRKGDHIMFEVIIDDITETAAGEILKIITRGYRDRDILFESDTGIIVRRRRHGDGKRNGIRLLETPGADNAGDEVKLIIKTRAGQEKEYAKVSKDTNPIHTSRIFAKIAGFPGTIMHGVCVMAMCTNTMIENFADGDNRKLRSVSGRFTYPVYPGDTLTLVCSRGRRGRFHEINFNLYSPKGKAVIKKGHFLYSE